MTTNEEGNVNVLSICSGIGGIELGLRLACPEARTVCYVEREVYCAAVLVARMQEKLMDEAPIWTDLTTFDGKPWRGKVDCISAGFPCQPWSVAGKRKGTEDERWLWPAIARIVGEVGPRFVFLENVPGLLRGGVEHVLGSLASLGFDAEWDCFRASDVGAPHKRERVFLLAYNASVRGDKTTERYEQGQPVPIACREGAGNAICSGHDGRASFEGRETECGIAIERSSESMANGLHPGLEVGGGERKNDGEKRKAVERSGKEVADAKSVIIQRQPPTGTRFAWPPGPDADLREWPEGIEPSVCRVADGIPYRLDRLRALGNGVVPLVAAVAWNTLRKRLAQ